MLWWINYNNFAHTAHHIRKVHLLRRALTFLFLCYGNNKTYSFLKKKKERAQLVCGLFELSWHKVLVEESVGKIIFYH